MSSWKLKSVVSACACQCNIESLNLPEFYLRVLKIGWQGPNAEESKDRKQEMNWDENNFQCIIIPAIMKYAGPTAGLDNFFYKCGTARHISFIQRPMRRNVSITELPARMVLTLQK